MTREEKLAYQRGYNKGIQGKWPEHKPPLPPDEVARDIILAARRLRDAVDGELGAFDPEDAIQERLGPHIDAFDAAMVKLSEWLKEPTP